MNFARLGSELQPCDLARLPAWQEWLCKEPGSHDMLLTGRAASSCWNFHVRSGST